MLPVLPAHRQDYAVMLPIVSMFSCFWRKCKFVVGTRAAADAVWPCAQPASITRAPISQSVTDISAVPQNRSAYRVQGLRRAREEDLLALQVEPGADDVAQTGAATRTRAPRGCATSCRPRPGSRSCWAPTCGIQTLSEPKHWPCGNRLALTAEDAVEQGPGLPRVREGSRTKAHKRCAPQLSKSSIRMP